MKLPRSVGSLLVATIAATLGCGSRTPLDSLDVGGSATATDPNNDTGAVTRPEDDAGTASDSSTSSSSSSGGAGAGSGVGAGANRCNAVTSPPAPWCVPTSTCSSELFAVGLGWATGERPIETVSINCRSTPTDVEQWVGGSWLSLEPFFPVAEDPGGPGDVFDIAVPIGTAVLSPPSGDPVGSVQAFRACTTAANGCTTCDPESIVSIQNCFMCPPMDCGAGYFVDDNCQCAKNPPPFHPP